MSAYKLLQLQTQSKIVDGYVLKDAAKSKVDNELEDVPKLKEVVLKERNAEKIKAIQGLVKSSVDLIIPAQRLGWVDVNDGVVGVCGTFTSFIGIYDTFPTKC